MERERTIGIERFLIGNTHFYFRRYMIGKALKSEVKTKGKTIVPTLYNRRIIYNYWRDGNATT